MLSTEQFDRLCKLLVQLTAAVQAVAVAKLNGAKQVLDGTITDEEQLANLEGWEIIKIFEQANCMAHKPENAQAHGFQHLPPLTAGTSPSLPDVASKLVAEGLKAAE